ncbi:hypothetical protein ACFWE3_09920 [Mycobacteriaceae bacterium NPDC060252]
MVADFTRSQIAEDVCGFAWLAVAAYDKSEMASRAVADWKRENELDRAVLSAISEIVSHAEVFVGESLTRHAKLLSATTANPIPKIVMEATTKPVEATWAGKRSFIFTWFGEDLSGQAWWKRWMGFVDARNAWAHGLGRLTSRQLKTQETMTNLKAAGLVVRASQVVGSADDVRRCARSAVEVIDWIDKRVARS